MTSPSLVREVEQRLREREIRYTSGRRVVVAALARAEGPRSAAELSTEIGAAVPLSSLYRSLAVLEDAGVVVPHFGARGLTRYELADWITGHHHHLICVACGTVDDVEILPEYEIKVNELVDLIAQLAGFEPRAHDLEIEGRCAKCS